MVTTSTYWDNDGIYFSAQTYYGLSTDTKPSAAPNGSVFIEMDTSKIYFFDAENSQWREWSGMPQTE